MNMVFNPNSTSQNFFPSPLIWSGITEHLAQNLRRVEINLGIGLTKNQEKKRGERGEQESEMTPNLIQSRNCYSMVKILE